MTIGSFILKNALRNKRRALLSVLSVAVSLFLLVTLLVALREMTVPAEDVRAAQRIAVRHRVSLANLLPARQLSVIQRIPGVAGVTPFTYYGGKYKNEEIPSFAQFAMDPLQMTNIFGEAKVASEQLAAWYKDRRSCIVGKLTMERYKFKLGDTLPMTSMLWPCDLEFKIVGVYEGTPDDRNVMFHHKYLDEASGNTGMVGTWWVRANSLEEVPLVVERINKAFANTSAEVLAETERAFVMSFVSMWGNIKVFIGTICSVVVFTLVLVSASTMSMAIRERFRELAVLKALGFQRRELFAFILAESFGLAMTGAIIGVGGAWALYTHANINQLTNGFFIVAEVTPRIMGMAFIVAAGLGIISSLLPSLAVARTTVVEGLRTLD
ncbi:MAG: ABC transporter permease [Verrucomicrobiota bacterium]